MADVTIINFFLHRRPGPDPFAAVPLGPLYLCSALEERGYNVMFLDYQLTPDPNPYSAEGIAGFLMQAESDVLGISCMTNMLPFLVLGLRRLREQRRGLYVVLGGSGPSGVAEDILQSFPEIDAVVSGEGEAAIVELMEARKGERDFGSVGNLRWRDGDSVRSNAIRPRGRVLEDIARPAYHHLEMARYVNTPILTARGCPYKCSFCDIAPNWQRRVAYRQIDDVIDELTSHKEQYGANCFSILDDIFTLSRKRVDEFCRKLIARRLNISWSCMCRADLVNDPLMDLMREAGCQRMFLGIESGSPRVRKLAGKGLAIENVEPLIASAARRFDVLTSFILGFPFETVEDFESTILLMIYSSALGATPQISILSPLPQAELTCSSDYRLEFDPELVSTMVFPEFRSQSSGLGREVLTPDVQRLIEGDDKIFSAFYHFKEGRVREKLALARRYGLRF